MATWIAVGPTARNGSVELGLASLALVSGAGVAVNAARDRRLLVATALALVAGSISLAALSLTDPAEFRYKSALAEIVGAHWPRPDPSVESLIARSLGTEGFVATNTLGFISLPLPLLTFARLRASRRTFVNLLWLIATVALSIPVAAGGCRSCTLGLAAGLTMVIVVGLPKRRSAAVAGLLVALILAGLMLVATGDQRSLVSRLATWRIGTSEALQSMPFGLGFGVFSARHPDLYHAHNTLLQTLLDFGLVGLVGLGFAFALSIRNMWPLARASAVDQRIIAQAAVASLGAMLVAGIADSVVSTSIPHGGVYLGVISPVPMLVMSFCHRLPPPANSSTPDVVSGEPRQPRG